jgi:hypothetical protein
MMKGLTVSKWFITREIRDTSDECVFNCLPFDHLNIAFWAFHFYLRFSSQPTAYSENTINSSDTPMMVVCAINLL